MDCPNPFVDKVKCAECKHWIDKSDSSSVRIVGLYSDMLYYCPMHKKAYDESWVTTLLHPLYFGRVQMNDQGIPLGYVKKKI